MMAPTVRSARHACLGTIVFLGALLTSLPASGSVVLAQVASGIGSPTDIQNARDGSGRLFFVQQTGQIMVWKNGVVLPTAFLNIASLIVAGGEQGLLGLAFHPDYRNNGYFYVNYTRGPDGATVVARYSRSATDPDVADAQSATVLLTIAQPFANHNGGAVRFGPDGYLYIGMGDGGSGNDPLNTAQDLTSLLGKMLRIDVNTTTGQLPYGIPPDNPFAGSPQPGIRAEIWAYGLRNPWRFSFDKVAGDLFIGDVGQGAREEIDFVRAGAVGGLDFGWRVMEGTQCTNLGGGPPCGDLGFIPPIVEYDHGLGCSVTGGYLYRGLGVPELMLTSPPAAGQLFNGVYVYGDFCSGTIWRLNATAAGGVSNSILLASGLLITTFGEDESGEIYVADAGAGTIYRFVSTVPSGLSATGVSPSQINLAWTAVADNVGVIANKVYRDGVLIATLGNVTSYSDTGLTASTAYSYTVQACDGAGNCSDPSASASAITLADPVTLQIDVGWNLVGNSSSGVLDVASAFGDTTKVTTVWKWIANSAKWAFYAPSLVGQALIDYATGNGYDILTTISGGEGFWVNANLAGSVNLPNGNAISVATLGPTLITGWNLLSVGETVTPKQFCDAQSGGVTTLWAWDATNLAWYFYAPSLDANGGLSSYITAKGYLDFTTNSKTLGPASGFWLNKP